MTGSGGFYGTVMIGRSNAGVEQMRSLVEGWADSIGRAAGFVDERVLESSDGRIVVCVRFRDQAAYEALADLPAQHEWWNTQLAPLLDGDPEWIDGHWHDIWPMD